MRKSTRRTVTKKCRVRARLPAAQNIDRRRNRRIEAGRQRQARPDQERKQNEDHEQVCQPAAIRYRTKLRLRPAVEAQMVDDLSQERLPRAVGRELGTRSSGNVRSPNPRSHRAGRSAPTPRQPESEDTGSSHSGQAARSRSRSAPVLVKRNRNSEPRASQIRCRFRPNRSEGERPQFQGR